jgi:uncharacterized membrane protein
VYSDLIVAFMQGQDDAYLLRQALRAMRKQRLLGIEQSVAVSRDQEGKFQPCQADEPEGERIGSLAVLTTIVQSLFGEEAHTPAAGLDEAFVSALARARRDNSSALLFLLDRDGASDAGELRRVLSLFQTRICETTLSLEASDLPRLPAEPGSGLGLPTSGVPTVAREHLTAHWATSSADGD